MDRATNQTTDDLQCRQVAQGWIDAFASALEEGDYGAGAGLFRDDGYWRDILSFTWDVVTFQGPEQIAQALQATHPLCRARRFQLDVQPPVRSELGPHSTIDAFFLFETDTVLGRGFVRLVSNADDPETAQALNVLTLVKELKGYPGDPFVHRRRENTPQRSVENWADRRKRDAAFEGVDPEVVIVGAGQAGLALGARLNQLDVSTLIVDKMERVGDNWRKRYHSLTLHNEICTNHLPYLSFPETWPVYIPKDMLANFMEFYAMSMELNIWTSTTFLGGEYDPAQKRWTVQVQRADGSVRTLRPSQVVMAVGVSGIPSIPTIPGMDQYTGQVVHSSRSTHDLDVAGKSVLVVGPGRVHTTSRRICTCAVPT